MSDHVTSLKWNSPTIESVTAITKRIVTFNLIIIRLEIHLSTSDYLKWENNTKIKV